MIVLAIETATRDGSVALARDGRVLADVSGDGSRPHAARLPADALALLPPHGLVLADVDVLAVCLGPGGFTGLRVGIACAQGLAFATGRPIVGVSALDALGISALEEAEAEDIAGVWMDAARGEVFAVRYRQAPEALHGIVPIGEPVSAPPADVAAAWAADARSRVTIWIGDGAQRYRTLTAGPAVTPTPRLAPRVAQLGEQAARAGLAGAPHALRPIYVRPPDAELARARKGASR